MPLALARIHASAAVGERVGIRFPDWPRDRGDTTPPSRASLLEGAGFTVLDEATDERIVDARRDRTLPDTVGPAMVLLMVGLNPSIYSADAGVGFARPGNRFWPAMVTAGLVETDRDPTGALQRHGIGMTDLVKRATPRSAELRADEYRAGLERVEGLCRWLKPGAVCMVGLEGWRNAVDRRASTGLQDRRLGGRPVYVMGSTSGLNAHQQLPAAVEHLRAAWALAGAASVDPAERP